MAIKTEKTDYRWHADELVAAARGDVICSSVVKQFTDISTDTRTMGSEDVFLALSGEKFDGHDLVNKALESGKKAFVVAKEAVSKIDLVKCRQKEVLVVAVDNTLEALGRLGRYRKNKTGVKIAAITGSNGKTTTRAITECIFQTRFNAMGTKGNFNNAVGLPLTLLRLDMDTEWGIMELGMNAPGEINYLAGIAEPDIGAVINAGNAHLERLGSVEAVADAKCELLGHIRPDGAAVINGDDIPLLQAVKKTQTSARIVYYGYGKENKIYASDMAETETGTRFKVSANGITEAVHIMGGGRFMVKNALASAAMGIMAGITLPDIAAGISRFRPVPGRLTIKKNRDDIHIIDDTYNANPDSVREAIQVLKTKNKSGKTIAIIGDMLELGAHSKRQHYEVGFFCGAQGIDMVCATGEFADDIVTGALEAGITKGSVCSGSKEQVISFIQTHIISGDWVLVKGSRGMQMEKVVNTLMDRQDSLPENEPAKRGLIQ